MLEAERDEARALVRQRAEAAEALIEMGWTHERS
jgi:hypothetical protein